MLPPTDTSGSLCTKVHLGLKMKNIQNIILALYIAKSSGSYDYCLLCSHCLLQPGTSWVTTGEGLCGNAVVVYSETPCLSHVLVTSDLSVISLCRQIFLKPQHLSEDLLISASRCLFCLLVICVFIFPII